MQPIRSGIVDIVRDFLGVHGVLQSMTRRYAEGAMVFKDIEKFVGDDASSILFRLKESCHAIFRPSGSDSHPEVAAGALLDLVVGSLFHEAMALRENLYQLESYGAQVQMLRTQPRAAMTELLQEFVKIHAASSRRLDEAVTEIETLLGQARRQFLLVLVEYREEGLLVRCLWEHSEAVAATFGRDLLELLSEIYGEPLSALLLAADSYLDSAYYADAIPVLEVARSLDEGERAVDERIHYAIGMRSFMQRDYETSIIELREWWQMIRQRENGTNRIILATEALAHVESIMDDEFDSDFDADGVRAMVTELRAQLA